MAAKSPRPTQVQIAEALGVSSPRVTQLKQRGMPVHSIAAARAWVAANVQKQFVTNGQGRPADLQAARAEREQAEAEIAKLKLAEMEASLIDRARAASATFTAFRMLRDSLMTLGRHLAHDLATETEPRVIDRRITGAVREALDLFANRTLPDALKQGAMADLEDAP